MIVLSGKKRSGKDTVAKFMRECGLETYALADPIKAALLYAFNKNKPYSMTNDMLYGIDYDRETILDFDNNAIRSILFDSVMFTLDEVNTDKLEKIKYIEKIVPFIREINGPFSVRKFMQVFGTDIMCNLVSNQHWLKLSEMKAPFDAIITDVRQPWEEEYFRNKNADFVFVVGKYEGYKESDDTHITELGLTPKENDHILVNKDLKKLAKDTKCLLKKLMN